MKVAVAKVQVYLHRLKKRSEKFADLFTFILESFGAVCVEQNER